MDPTLENRIKKRLKHLRKFAERWPTNAYRVYDWDIPEFPWSVDVYGDQIQLQYFQKNHTADQLDWVPERIQALFEVEADAVHFKERHRRFGTQYEKLSESGSEFVVFEGPHQFYVNLDSYIDSGLFLDHRNLRREVAAEVGRRRRPEVLNLFSYTGAFSVWSAAAGGHVTTVDLSNTYLEWAQRNFELNKLNVREHNFVRSDILRWLPQQKKAEQFDVIVLDPPTWSRSKKMDGELDVQRDHPFMIRQCVRLLRPGGVIYFSTNYKGFKLELDDFELPVKEISNWTVPEDFKKTIHRAFEIRKP
jgi:23S rRNA (cytosine1962-C5)-methyltransferase